MNDENLKEKNYEYVRLALPLMSKHEVPITPKNYAVWYMYVSGESRGLNAIIDKMILNRRLFDEEINEKLYHQFCSEKNENELKKFRAGLHQILEVMLKEVMDLTGQTGQYETVLSRSISRLSENVSDDNIMDVINEIIEETKTMGNHGRSIQQKLQETTENLNTIQKEFEEAKNAALLDFLTGVPNRKALNDKFAEYVSEASPVSKDLCMLLIDIDHFKKFNDKFGHVVGDEVLRFAAKKIKDIVRGRDFFARYGGEEFAVLLPQTPLSGAETVGEHIRKFFSESPIKTVSESVKLGSITVSIGAACYRPDETFEELIARSDKALYHAKNTGRNRVATESDISLH